MKSKVAIFWFRRDLRLTDNIGLHHALKGKIPVLPVFIFDTEILGRVESKVDRRVDYIHQALLAVNEELKQYGSTLLSLTGNPDTVFQLLLKQYDIQTVYCNDDYEPQGIERDTAVLNYLAQRGISFKAYKDQVIFDKTDILKPDGKPYTVYTPYARRWKEAIRTEDLESVQPDFSNFFRQPFLDIVPLKEIQFEKTDLIFKPPVLDLDIIRDYDKFREFPALQQTTQLGIALRYGTISIRKCVAFALQHNRMWLSELIWREFFMQILFHFPLVVLRPFKAKYDQIEWKNDENDFKRWCEGRTGYPLVDAGMRQLNQTGFMHNRVRMVAASFLCKHLLIDWRWGERYFASKLNDYDLSANNGNWQWAAGCGCDAAPYFRIFNPELQAKKFDKDQVYIKRWIPELESHEYLKPIVQHKHAHERTLMIYSKALKPY